jgi:hypothetical protein
MYPCGRLKTSNQFKRLWHEILGVTSTIKLTDFFGKVNICLSVKMRCATQELFRTILGGENRQIN